MLLVVGSIVVLACVLGGYMLAGGHMIVLFQPFEFLIIGGAAVGAFIIGNPKTVLSKVGGGIGKVIRGPQYTKEDYLELLSLLYIIFKMAKTKGMLTLESHVENPEESTLFAMFPKFLHNHHALVFLCDYMRLLILGTDNAHEVESLMDEELETHHAEDHAVSGALQTMADGMPALGIVAAVLGVIHTMGSITEPPEVLGHLIGGALVGTFLGVAMSYGFVGPVANSLKAVQDAESKYLTCIKAGLLAYMQGYAPAVAVEFARKALLSDVRPTFIEVEEAVQSTTPPAS